MRLDRPALLGQSDLFTTYALLSGTRLSKEPFGQQGATAPRVMREPIKGEPEAENRWGDSRAGGPIVATARQNC